MQYSPYEIASAGRRNHCKKNNGIEIILDDSISVLNFVFFFLDLGKSIILDFIF
jgi:hypothetical protein